MVDTVDRRSYTIGARYKRNESGNTVILDDVQYDIETDSHRATFHFEMLNDSITHNISDFLDQYTLATPADVPLASEPEPKWWRQVKAHSEEIEKILAATFEQFDSQDFRDAKAQQIAVLCEIINDTCDAVDAFEGFPGR